MLTYAQPAEFQWRQEVTLIQIYVYKYVCIYKSSLSHLSCVYNIDRYTASLSLCLCQHYRTPNNVCCDVSTSFYTCYTFRLYTYTFVVFFLQCHYCTLFATFLISWRRKLERCWRFVVFFFFFCSHKTKFENCWFFKP